mgnify:CR=1 FL=1|jgi:hypothetical protein
MAPSSGTPTFLAIDFGSTHTRAFLLAPVGGRFSLVASGLGPAPFRSREDDADDCAREAIQSIQEVTGFRLLDSEGRVLSPALSPTRGVDQVLVTFSAGPPLRLALVAPTSRVSLADAGRLASTSYAEVVASLSLKSLSKEGEALDALVRAKPDWIILAGGTEGGAEKPLLQMGTILSLYYQSLAREERPGLLYVGNQEMAQSLEELLDAYTPVMTTANIRPSTERTNLLPAQEALGELASRRNLSEMKSLTRLAHGTPTASAPSALALGQAVRLLSKAHESPKPWLAVDVGASFSTFAAAQGGRLVSQTMPIGLGKGVQGLLGAPQRPELGVWLEDALTAEEQSVYLENKVLYPCLVPVTPQALEIEQAAARVVLKGLRTGLEELWPAPMPPFEAVVLSGGVFSRSAHPWQALLMALDGLQPAGVTPVYLDSADLLPALGAAAQLNPLVLEQVFASPAFLHLATVISPQSRAKGGARILSVTVEVDGVRSKYAIKQGELACLPLAYGRGAKVSLRGFGGTRVALAHGERSPVAVTGGLLGLVVDARGRPLTLPSEDNARRSLLHNWYTPPASGPVA